MYYLSKTDSYLTPTVKEDKLT